MEKRERSYMGMQTSTATMENRWRFLKKLEIELPYNPAIPLLGIHTEETRTERDTCTPMFIAALLTRDISFSFQNFDSSDSRMKYTEDI